MKIVAVVLTLNEERHIRRCLESVRLVTKSILVVDSYSTDRTCEIALSMGARVVQHPFVNYATQFNWALDHVDIDTDWLLRIDADECITQQLASEINNRLSKLSEDIAGVYFLLRIIFIGSVIRHGGVSSIRLLRLWRKGKGRCENRWMDEHIKVHGASVSFKGELIHDNLNSLTWWTAKHNGYSNREALDLLNLKYGFMPVDSAASLSSGSQVAIKRWLKEKLYSRLPGGLRAFGYFFYRYFFALGFLDGKGGLVFHFLQGFWYRFLVDAKVYEVERCMALSGCSITDAIEHVLGIQVLAEHDNRSGS
jgi:glycosyltransferase involved in cell wall biosynthesis